MKKTIFGFVVILITVLPMSSYGQHFYAGVVGGLNFADLKIGFTDPTITNYETRSRSLFAVGGILGVSVNEYLSVQLEPLYTAKGGILARNSTEMKIRSSHLDLPLVARLGIGKAVRPFIAVGPFISVLLDARMSAEMAGRVWEGDVMQILKRTEYGILVGAGVGIPIWNGSVLIEGRYSPGLTNVNKGGSFDLEYGSLAAARVTTDPKDEIKTRSIFVMIGYQLPLGGE